VPAPPSLWRVSQQHNSLPRLTLCHVLEGQPDGTLFALDREASLTTPRYLPAVAAIAAGMALTSHRAINSLEAAIGQIGYGITNALNEANRKVHMTTEPTQEEKNMILLEMYGERSSLEDMERAIAGMEARLAAQKDRSKILEEAYGDKSSLQDLQRAMQIYEVQ
jgi:hypothetical protein